MGSRIIVMIMIVAMVFVNLIPNAFVEASSVSSAATTTDAWLATGPVSDLGDGVAVSPNFANDRTIFLLDRRDAGSFGVDLMKSVDAGVTWSTQISLQTNLGSGGSAIVRISPNYAIDSIVFLQQVFQNKTTLHKSLDRGVTWAPILEIDQRLEFFNISPNFANDQVIVFSGGLSSKDGGQTWVQPTNVWPGGSRGCYAHFSPNTSIDSSIFLVCPDFRNSVIYKSSDFGFTWDMLAGIQSYVNSIAFSPNFGADSTVFVHTHNLGVMVSTDGGATWAAVNTGIDTFQTSSGYSRNNLISLSPNYSVDQTLFTIIEGNKIYRSTNAGASWLLVDYFAFTSQQDITFSPAYSYDKTVFLSGSGGVHKSVDGGNTWISVSPRLYPIGMNKVAVSPAYSSDHTVFAVTNGGYGVYGNRILPDLYRSSDSGHTWKSMRSDDINTVELSPNYAADQTIFIGTTSVGFYALARIYKSTDGGITWTDVSAGLPTNYNDSKANVQSFSISPNFAIDKTVFAATSVGIYKSIDSGSTWVKANNSPSSLRHVIVSPAFGNDNTVFAGTYAGVFRSSDGGQSWQPINQGLTFPVGQDTYTHNITSLEASPNYASDHTLVISTFDGGPFITTDGGEHWVPINTGLPIATHARVIFSPNYGTDSTLFTAISGSGVFASTNKGQSWATLNDTLDNLYSSDLSVVPDGRELYLASGTLWKRVLEATAPQPSLSLSISAPAALAVVDGQYFPQPFTATVLVKNTGKAIATNVVLSLNSLPSGLSMAPDSPSSIMQLGTIAPGSTREMNWLINASPQNNAVQLTYSATTWADNIDVVTHFQQIRIPILTPPPDADCDSLPDRWEEQGYNGVDLPKLGASKNHKDIFVYVEWFADLPFITKPNSFDEVIKAFAAAPTPLQCPNPDGKPGINLHIIWGKGITNTGNMRVIGSTSDDRFGIWQKFVPIRDANFPSMYRPIAHFALFGDEIADPIDVAGNAQPDGLSDPYAGRLGANSFIVAPSHLERAVMLPYFNHALQGIFMHELGHNLGLDHGGVTLDDAGNAIGLDGINNKPNHLSVMNYLFETTGIRPAGILGEKAPYTGRLDYSQFDTSNFVTINEGFLNEQTSLAIGKKDKRIQQYGSWYYCGNNLRPINDLYKGVDWNCINGIEKKPTSTDVNNENANLQRLTTMNEWLYLAYGGGGHIGVPAQ